MQPEDRDAAFLWDMLQACEEIAEFTRGVSYSAFEGDRKLRYAVERQLLVVGEAANHVSSPFRESHPEVDWANIVGLRNVLAHEYGEVLVERVWVVAREQVPQLVRFLKHLVPEPPRDTDGQP